MELYAYGLYAINSLRPLTIQDCEVLGWTLASVIPVDFAQGERDDESRYVNIVYIPVGTKMMDNLHLISYAKPYSYQWLTYVSEV